MMQPNCHCTVESGSNYEVLVGKGRPGEAQVRPRWPGDREQRVKNHPEEAGRLGRQSYKRVKAPSP